MHGVLLILLHRPFVAEGHLATPSVAADAWQQCTTAANYIVQIVRAYDRAFSVRRARYLISYATYVAATIHVRIAAQREPESEAHLHLRVCLQVFKQNERTNRAVRRANTVINNLMIKLNVKVAEQDLHDDSMLGTAQKHSFHDQVDNLYGEQAADGSSSEMNYLATESAPMAELDIDSIIQSFSFDQQRTGQHPQPPQTYFRPPVREQWDWALTAASPPPAQYSSFYGPTPRQSSVSSFAQPAMPSTESYYTSDMFGLDDVSLTDMLFGFGNGWAPE